MLRVLKWVAIVGLLLLLTPFGFLLLGLPITLLLWLPLLWLLNKGMRADFPRSRLVQRPAADTLGLREPPAEEHSN